MCGLCVLAADSSAATRRTRFQEGPFRLGVTPEGRGRGATGSLRQWAVRGRHMRTGSCDFWASRHDALFATLLSVARSRLLDPYPGRSLHSLAGTGMPGAHKQRQPSVPGLCASKPLDRSRAKSKMRVTREFSARGFRDIPEVLPTGIPEPFLHHCK